MEKMARVAFWKEPNKKQRRILERIGLEVVDTFIPREYALDGFIKTDKLQRLRQLIFVKKVYCRC